MLKIETIYTNKVIISGLQEDILQKFIEHMIEFAWVNSKLPGSARFVKESEYATLEKLPKNFSIKETAERAVKRNALVFETLGPVYVGLSVKIMKNSLGVNPTIKIDIDKFLFERDERDRNLNKFVVKMLAAWEEKQGNGNKAK